MNDKPKGKMHVEEIDVAGQRRRRRWMASVLIAVSVTVVVGGSFLAWYLTPPALPTTAEEAMAVVKSPRFQRLNKENKQPYYDVIREQFGMDRQMRQVWREDPELRDASRDMFREMMTQRMNAYMLAGPAERAAMLENSPWGRPRGGEGGRPGGDPGGERGQRGGESDNASGGRGGRDPGGMRDRISDRLANGSAQQGAAMGEMIQARRQQREAEGN